MVHVPAAALLNVKQGYIQRSSLNMKQLHIHAYKEGFENSTDLQACVSRRMQLFGRWTKRAFISMFAVFALSAFLIAAYNWWPAGLLMLVFVALVPGAFLLGQWRLSRQPPCPKCSKPFRTEWMPVGGKGVRFGVCDDCKLYIDTHFGSR